MQANTKQARALLRRAIQRSIANYGGQKVEILHTYTDNKGTLNAKRYVVFVLRAQTEAQLHDVHNIAEYLFAHEGNNFANKITLTGMYVVHKAQAYLRCVADLA